MKFEDLLARVKGDTNFDALKTELDAARAEAQRCRVALDAALAKVTELAERIAAPMRRAVQAAEALNIPVPQEFQTAAEQATDVRQTPKSNGTYEWTTTGRKPKHYTISEAAWYLTRGRGGPNKGGRLSTDDLVEVAQIQTGTNLRELVPGQSITFTLGNNVWTVRKVSE